MSYVVQRLQMCENEWRFFQMRVDFNAYWLGTIAIVLFCVLVCTTIALLQGK